MRRCTGIGHGRADGSRLWREVSQGHGIDGLDGLVADSAVSIPMSATDPLAIEGQQPGATLAVMRTSEFVSYYEGTKFAKVENMQVRDFTDILSHSGNE